MFFVGVGVKGSEWRRKTWIFNERKYKIGTNRPKSLGGRGGRQLIVFNDECMCTIHCLHNTIY